jgi:hypothetical protein
MQRAAVTARRNDVRQRQRWLSICEALFGTVDHLRCKTIDSPPSVAPSPFHIHSPSPRPHLSRRPPPSEGDCHCRIRRRVSVGYQCAHPWATDGLARLPRVSSLSRLRSHGRARLGDAPPPRCVGVPGNSTFRAPTPQGTPGTRAPPPDAGYSTLQPVTPLRTDAPCLGQRLALELFLAVADRHRGDRLGAARNDADAAGLADHLGPDATTQQLNK